MFKRVYLLISLIYSIYASAQVEHFNMDNGLPSDRVYDVTVDNKGFLWVATDKGVANYNGDKFTLYTTANGLPVNDIFTILPTEDGKLWYLGKSNRLGYIQNGQVYNFPSDKNAIMNPVKYILYGNRVGFYFGATAHYLFNNTWYAFQMDFDDGSLKYQVFIHPIFNANILYDANTFNHLDNDGRKIKSFPIHEKDWNLRSWVDVFYLDSLFYAITPNNLYAYNFFKKELHTFPVKLTFEFKDVKQTHFFFDNKKFGITDSRLRYIISDTNITLDYKFEFDLPDSSAVGLYPDLSGNLWLNTQLNGVYRYPYNMKTSVFFKDQRIQHIELDDDEMYAGVENKGLFKINTVTDQTDCIFNRSTYFYGVEKDYSGKTKVLTNYHHFYYSKGKTEDLTFIEPNQWPSSGGKASVVSDDTLILLAPYCIRVANMKTKRELALIDLVGSYDIEKYNSKYILATNSGLKYFSYPTVYAINSFPDHPVKCLTKWRNYLVIGTEGFGVYYWDNKFFGHSEFLKTENINNLYVDEENSLWICSNNGVHKISVSSEGTVKTLSILKSNGLVSNHVNDVRKKNNLIYIATDKGLCIIKEEGIIKNTSLGIIIPSIELNDSSFLLDNDTLKTPSRSTNSISVKYDIGFLGEHSQLRTYYKLEPIHTNWIETNSREIEFAGLKAGNYTLKIKVEAFNNIESSLNVHLIFKPRWYEYSLFKYVVIGLSILLFTSLTIITASYIIRYNKRRFMLQKKMVDIELDALRSKLDPHFIFNILNSLQLQINLNDTDSSEKLLLLFSNHIRNAFDYSQKKSITLDQEINFIREYLSLETIRFKERIKWDIKIDPRLDIHAFVIPSMLLQPYVENAIKHGFKDKIKEALLSIEFIYVDPNSYTVNIIDNGKGISTDPSQRKSSTGILGERIQLLNQSGEWNITKTVSNVNPNETNKGTIITINFTKPDTI